MFVFVFVFVRPLISVGCYASANTCLSASCSTVPHAHLKRRPKTMFFESTRSVCLLPGLQPTPPFGLFCCQVCYIPHPLGCSVARFAMEPTLWVVLLPGLPSTPPCGLFCCQVCHRPHPVGCSVARFAIDPTLWVVLLPGLPSTPARET